MASINEVTLLGRLGCDPDYKMTPGGQEIAYLSIATEDTPAKGQEKGKTQWHRAVFFGTMARVLTRYAKRGHLILVKARLSYSEYTDKAGQKNYKTDLIGVNLHLLQFADQGAQNGGGE